MTTQEPILVFYDGRCSVCVRSARRFDGLDGERGVVECVDFRTDPSAESRSGADLDTLAKSLHARLPTGELLDGPEAIRAVMGALGRGWQARWTRWPLIKPVADAAYRVFARNRLRWFGNQACDDGGCAIDPSREN